MKFKIDTKEKIIVFSPEETVLDANLSEEFLSTIRQLPGLKTRNLILDMRLLEKADDAGIKAILTVYDQQYANNHSCAIAGLNSTLTQQLKTTGGDMLNIAPTHAEAVDLVMMEELERELMQGEEEL